MAWTGAGARVDGAEETHGLLCSRGSYSDYRHVGRRIFKGWSRMFREVGIESMAASCYATVGRSRAPSSRGCCLVEWSRRCHELGFAGQLDGESWRKGE